MAAIVPRRRTIRMTTITAEPTVHQSTVHQPARRMTRRTIMSFLAGVILTGAVAVGFNVASGDSSSNSTPGAPAAHVAPAPEPGCFVVRGAC